MNQKLSERLATLPEALSKATNEEAVSTAVSEVERLVLKSTFDDAQSGSLGEYVSQDYVVGERNTRGLSWKLNLLRTVAQNTFTELLRVGVHGGNVKLLGYQDHINATLAIYNALVDAYGTVAQAAFTSFSDENKPAEGDAPVHKAGWINQFLLAAPDQLGEDLTASREKDLGSNAKAANVIAEQSAALKAFKETILPPPAPRAPRKSKAVAEGEEGAEGNGEAENDSASEDDESTQDDTAE